MPRPKREQTRYYLKRLKGGSNWHICWTDETGKPISRSTRTPDEPTARQFLAAYIEALNAPPEEANITIADICALYLRHKKEQLEQRGASKNCYSSLEYSLMPILSRWGDWHPSALTRQQGRAYVSEKLKIYSPATVSRQLSILNAALNHAWKEGCINQPRTLQLPPPPPPKDRWITRQEAAGLLDACNAPHLRLFVMLAIHTCSRKGAILELKWQQVDMQSRIIHFNPPDRRQTNKRRVPVPINDTLYSALKDALELAQSDHVIEYGGKPVQDVKKAFAMAAKKASLKGVTPHTLRHTGATWLAQAGVDMLMIAGLLGDSIRTTEKNYIKHHPDYLRKAVNALQNVS